MVLLPCKTSALTILTARQNSRSALRRTVGKANCTATGPCALIFSLGEIDCALLLLYFVEKSAVGVFPVMSKGLARNTCPHT